MIKQHSLAVIGVGTAGILSLSHFISILDNSWDVVSIYNPNIDIVGIGESTNPSFIETLEYGLNFSLLDDMKYLDATPKYATRYKNWKSEYIDSPLLGGRAAIHFNNKNLKKFAFDRLSELWPEKFKVLEGNVESLNTVVSEDFLIEKAQVIVDGISYYFDWVIDCRGFPKDFSEYTVFDGMPANHCLVHNKQIPGDWNYTGHRATQDGWMFEIPLSNRQSYGYIFNDTITSVSRARENFAKEINVEVTQLENIEYKFTSYCANKGLDGRIFKNGNNFGFFEPMSATSLWMYAGLNKIYEEVINSYVDKNPIPEIIVNQKTFKQALMAKDIICFFYHGGSNYDTQYWKKAVEYCSKYLKQPGGFIERLVTAMSCGVENGTPFSRNITDAAFGARPHFFFDKKFKHHYFTKP